MAFADDVDTDLPEQPHIGPFSLPIYVRKSHISVGYSESLNNLFIYNFFISFTCLHS